MGQPHSVLSHVLEMQLTKCSQDEAVVEGVALGNTHTGQEEGEAADGSENQRRGAEKEN